MSYSTLAQHRLTCHMFSNRITSDGYREGVRIKYQSSPGLSVICMRSTIRYEHRIQSVLAPPTPYPIRVLFFRSLRTPPPLSHAHLTRPWSCPRPPCCIFCCPLNRSHTSSCRLPSSAAASTGRPGTWGTTALPVLKHDSSAW